MRKTTSYLVLVPTDDTARTISEMSDRCPVMVEQTASRGDVAGLRFRIPTNDDAAMDLAREIAGDSDFTLSTGYGAHHRDIGSRP